MIDLTKSLEAKSDQLNSADLIAAPRTIKITKVSAGNKEQPIAVNYDGDDGKPYYPSKGMRRAMAAIWGVKGDAYVGRSMTLYNEPTVRWGGIEVGGIRISHMSHIDKVFSLALTISRTSKQAFEVKPLKVAATPSIPLQELPETDKPSLETDADVLRVAMREAAAIGEKEFIAIWLGMTADEKITMNDYKNELKQQLTEGK